MTSATEKITLKEVVVSAAEAWSQTKGKKFNLNKEVLNLQLTFANKILKSVNNERGVLAFLNAPTGFGKTEAFVIPFLYSYLNDCEVFAPRMYIVEPMHALLKQFSERLQVYIKALNLDGVLDVGEDHGNVTSRTYLYTASITLTTLDSYAYGFLAKRVETYKFSPGVITGRYSTPAGLQALSYTVLDEAHLIQDEAYVGPRIIQRIVASLVCSGGVVVISSATLPDTLQNQVENEVNEWCSNRYTLVNEELDKIIESIEASREISFEYYDNKSIEDAVKDNVKAVCEDRTLIIVNTIEKAITLYDKLRTECGKSASVILLHSLTRTNEKSDKFDRIRNATKEHRKYVVIGTQVLEVGLDFDFNKLYTELAPIDALIQRMGRICRDKQRNCEVYIYKPKSSLPYIDDLIEASKKALIEHLGRQGKINLFNVRTIRALVNSVYDKDIIKKLEAKGDELFLEFVDYMERLHLVSYPPEEDVFVRPSFYVTLSLMSSREFQEEFRCSEQRDECDGNIVRLKNYEFKVSVPLIEGRRFALTRLQSIVDRVEKLKGEIYVPRKLELDKIKLRKTSPKDISRVDRINGHYIVLVLEQSAFNNIYDDEHGLRVDTLKYPEQQQAPTTKKQPSTSKRKRKSGSRS
ncbi:MAG: CRISPR-associated helicase Cas3' [Desulfurococcaceae archaeon]